MHFCPVCMTILNRNTDLGKVLYKCGACTTVVEGSAEDALIVDTSHTVSTALFTKIIESAAYDRVNQKAAIKCPDCGVPYLVQVRLGASEIVEYVCICGFHKKAKDMG